MFLDNFCNDSGGWGPLNSSKNDLTPCAQSFLIITPFCLIFIILSLIYLFHIRRVRKRFNNVQLRRRLTSMFDIESSTKNKHNNNRNVNINNNNTPNTQSMSSIFSSVCCFELVFSFLFTLALLQALGISIVLPSIAGDNINWVIWTLSWEFASWFMFTWLFYAERRFVTLYGVGEAPSKLVRWFWISQALIALKNLESIFVGHFVNDSSTDHINFVFYLQSFAVFPSVLLALRGLFLHSSQPKQDIGYDSLYFPSHLTKWQHEEEDDDFDGDLDANTGKLKMKQRNAKLGIYIKTPEETASLWSLLTFGWLTPLFQLGYKRALEMSDLSFVQGKDHAREAVKVFYKAWREQLNKARLKNKNRITNENENENKTQTQKNKINPIQSSINDSNNANAPLLDEFTNNKLERAKSDPTSMPKQVKEEDGDGKPSVVKALLSAFGGPYAMAIPLKLIYDCFQYASPVILSQYLRAAEDFPNQDAVKKAYIYSGMFFLTTMIGTVLLAQYFHRCYQTGMRVRAALMTACYEKALKLSPSAKSEMTTGQIMTMVTVDVRKMRDVFPYMIMLFSAPFQICIATYLLYQQISWTVFVGIGIQFVIMAPLQAKVGSAARKLQKEIMKIRDQRMKVTNEVFGAMKIVKMYAWEASFGEKITKIRNEELKTLRCYIWWYTGMLIFWGFAPTMVALGAFVAYTAAGHTLTAEKAFTSIALFNLLRFPLAMLPMVILSFIEANVCVTRIRKFLSANEIDPDVIEYASVNDYGGDDAMYNGLNDSNNKKDSLLDFRVPPPKANNNKKSDYKHFNTNAITMENASFTWDDAQNMCALKDLNFVIPNGTVTMIIGETGAGKSALLRAILGELTKSKGRLVYNEHIKVAYSSQVAWIQNATVKDNILFGNKFEKRFYEKVVSACALTDDLKILAGGDETEIGEKGINLSGGQKQRISLARAVYSGADVFVFDDPLSAVDSHVANHIFNECFVELLKGKTIILATHAVSFLKFADNVLVIEAAVDGGSIQMQGKLQDLIDANINLTKFIIHKGGSDGELDGDDDGDNDEHKGGDDDQEKEKKEKVSESIQKQEKNKKEGELVKEEERAQGNVSLAIYYLYVTAAGGLCLFIVYFFALSLYYGMGMSATFWLAYWSNAMSRSHQKSWQSSWFFLEVYTGIQLLSLLVLLSSSVIMLVTRLKASKYLHESMLSALMRAPMSFYDTTPIGRIINRFSRDMYAADQAVPGSYQSAIRITVSLFAVLIGVCVVTPYFAVMMLPLSVFYWYLQKYFISTSRELRRLSSLMNSPIYSNFSETISGASIIRSFGKSAEFSGKNQSMVDSDHEAYYPSFAANRWLAIRLEFIGNCLIGFAALSCAITQPTAGYVGVALSTIMSITQGLNWFVRQKAQLEQDIVAVERIDQYSNDSLSQEAPYHSSDQNSNVRTLDLKRGDIAFDNVWMKYRPELDYVLKGLTFSVFGGDKIGVIGRTGAGKSSLFVTLLRLVEISNKKSKILIDGQDISEIGLYDLRSQISVIPQDPILFTGTVRFNLDPFYEEMSEEREAKLINALSSAHCLDALLKMKKELEIKKEKDSQDIANSEKVIQEVDSNDDTNDTIKSVLDLKVQEEGSNFSVGQRQLLCLARAIVRGSQILLLDEATSAVDPQTDQNIQETIRHVFKDCTILTIAHRIDTILDYDKILIMDNGTVAEYDTPTKLLENENSKFSEIVQASFGVQLDDVIKSKIK